MYSFGAHYSTSCVWVCSSFLVLCVLVEYCLIGFMSLIFIFMCSRWVLFDWVHVAHLYFYVFSLSIVWLGSCRSLLSVCVLVEYCLIGFMSLIFIFMYSRWVLFDWVHVAHLYLYVFSLSIVWFSIWYSYLDLHFCIFSSPFSLRLSVRMIYESVKYKVYHFIMMSKKISMIYIYIRRMILIFKSPNEDWRLIVFAPFHLIIIIIIILSFFLFFLRQKFIRHISRWLLNGNQWNFTGMLSTMSRCADYFRNFQNGRHCHGNGQNAKKMKNTKMIIAGYSPNRNWSNLLATTSTSNETR
jgi:hypothetical protein